MLFSQMERRLLVASDTSFEGGKGEAGFLLVANPGCPEESRVGRVLAIPPGNSKFWGNNKTYIAQLELLVVLAAMVEFAHLVRRSKGLWLIDNIAALMAHVRGKNDPPSLDLMAQFVHSANFALQATPYYEYVEYAANWSEEISREGLRGAWAKDRRFKLGICTFVYQSQSSRIPQSSPTSSISLSLCK